jgi:indole-3-glycerol phosphate synthase
LLPVFLPAQVQEFTDLAHELNMEVLLEIHTEEELKHFNSNIDLGRN